MSIYLLKSFVVFLVCFLNFKAKSQSNRVLLRDINSLVLRKGEFTVSRRFNSVPQLQCVGGLVCRNYSLSLVHCFNCKLDGEHVQWDCKAHMSKDYEFGKIDVFCEGYNYPNDSYVLVGSCGIKYELNYTTCGAKKYLNSSLKTYSVDRLGFLYSVFALIFVWLIYVIMSLPNEEITKYQYPSKDKHEHCSGYEKVHETSFKKERESTGWLISLKNFFFQKRKESEQSTSSSFLNNKNCFTSLSPTQITLSNLAFDNQKLVDSVWNSSLDTFPLDKKCIEDFGISIYRRDLIKLRSGDWINDEIINFFMALIVDRSKQSRKYPKAYAFNSFFYGAYIDKGYDGVKKWTRGIDIFAYDIILVPLHMGAHWCLAVIDVALKSIDYYDSMLSDGTQCLLNLRNYLAEECVEKKKHSLDNAAYTLKNKKEIPTQKNGYDCGVFVCRFAECASRRVPMKFNSESMNYFRAQMTYEIYTAKLLF